MSDTQTSSPPPPPAAGIQGDYRVELDNYSGPLDLLLYLVRKNEIDLHNIPIAALTEQYLAYLDRIKEIDLDVAGEFLVMAATLLEIKSRMLVPADEQTDADTDDTNDEALDPRHELVQQLLAYKRYRDAAGELDARLQSWEKRLTAHVVEPSRHRRSANHDANHGADQSADQSAMDGEEDAQPVELDLDDVSVLDLCEAFARILDSIGATRQHEVVYDDTPIALHAEDILDRLQRDADADGMDLQTMFAGRSRGEAIGLFLATLELVKQRRVTARQDTHGAIRLVLLPEPSDDIQTHDGGSLEALEKWRDPATGEIDYDWPDTQTRRRAQRRAQRRTKRGFNADDLHNMDDDALDDALDDVDDDADGDHLADTPHDALDTDAGHALDEGAR